VHYQHNPIKTAKTSFLGTYNMLGLARRVGARLLLASTSEIYGDPEVHPQAESYRGCVNTIGLRSCYDEGKRIAETLCFLQPAHARLRDPGGGPTPCARWRPRACLWHATTPRADSKCVTGALAAPVSIG
jgi:hypothetical protein